MLELIDTIIKKKNGIQSMEYLLQKELQLEDTRTRKIDFKSKELIFLIINRRVSHC